MMVVSEMGEQWSPQTALARHADMPMKSKGLAGSKTLITIGIRIPKVPQEVPVENARKAAIKKNTTGRKLARSGAAIVIHSAINFWESSRVVIFLRDVARVRIRIAGTIAMKPSARHFNASEKQMIFRTVI